MYRRAVSHLSRKIHVVSKQQHTIQQQVASGCRSFSAGIIHFQHGGEVGPLTTPSNDHECFIKFEEIPMSQVIEKLNIKKEEPIKQPINKQFELKKEKTIGVVTFNRPDKMNSLSPLAADQFKQLFASETIQNNPRLAALILTGAPPPLNEDGTPKVHAAFSAGGDYDFLLERADDTPFNNAGRMARFYDW